MKVPGDYFPAGGSSIGMTRRDDLTRISRPSTRGKCGHWLPQLLARGALPAIFGNAWRCGGNLTMSLSG